MDNGLFNKSAKKHKRGAMKAKNIIIVQILLLVGAVIAGALLKDSMTDSGRTLHRAFGMLAAIAGLTSAVYMTIKGKVKSTKILLWLATTLTLFAGYSGNALKTTADYDKTFMMMRGSAVLALVVAVVVLAMLSKKSKD